MVPIFLPAKLFPSLLPFILLAAPTTLESRAADVQETATYKLTRIDSGITWCSSYWGSNAPKLVYDGRSFYSVGYWGAAQPESRITVYQQQGGKWISGFTAADADYQPGMLLLDSRKRLILIYGRQNAAPRILRSDAPGDIHHFSPLPVHPAIGKAGYIGAAIFDDKLIVGYIGDPATYSFRMAVLDLAKQTWTGPVLLAEAQRSVVPWTTWMYPIIRPEKSGIHVTISNNGARNNFYNKILYMRISHDLGTVSKPELVKEVPSPCASDNYAFADAMWLADDGAVYVTAHLAEKEKGSSSHMYRRDPKTGQWSDWSTGRGVAAVFQSKDEPGVLWCSSTGGPGIALTRSTDQGRSWEAIRLPDFPPGVSGGFLHGISPGSGSVMPESPCAVFSAGRENNQELWMIDFHTPRAVATVPSSAQ